MIPLTIRIIPVKSQWGHSNFSRALGPFIHHHSPSPVAATGPARSSDPPGPIRSATDSLPSVFWSPIPGGTWSRSLDWDLWTKKTGAYSEISSLSMFIIEYPNKNWKSRKDGSTNRPNNCCNPWKVHILSTHLPGSGSILFWWNVPKQMPCLKMSLWISFTTYHDIPRSYCGRYISPWCTNSPIMLYAD